MKPLSRIKIYLDENRFVRFKVENHPALQARIQDFLYIIEYEKDGKNFIHIYNIRDLFKIEELYQ